MTTTSAARLNRRWILDSWREARTTKTARMSRLARQRLAVGANLFATTALHRRK
jgi:hypothetical protein